MVEVESVIRKWGRSSLAFIIPKEITERENLKPNQKLKAILLEKDNSVRRLFGTLRGWKKSTDRIMREIDRELWPEE